MSPFGPTLLSQRALMSPFGPTNWNFVPSSAKRSRRMLMSDDGFAAELNSSAPCV